MKILYTAEATASGGREGRVRSTDGSLDLDLAIPKELGGPGGLATNPERSSSRLCGMLRERRPPRRSAQEGAGRPSVSDGQGGHRAGRLGRISAVRRAPRAAARGRRGRGRAGSGRRPSHMSLLQRRPGQRRREYRPGPRARSHLGGRRAWVHGPARIQALTIRRRRSKAPTAGQTSVTSATVMSPAPKASLSACQALHV